MSRPFKLNPKSEMVRFRMTEEDLFTLRRVASIEDTEMSRIIRKAVMAYCKDVLVEREYLQKGR